ncbi:hypothetical protein [Streptomyces mirabilis]|uniref:hypothetical protein n=1 Tax=Streptomyces mirabilis TaxID=68239 RepID=UPI0033BD483A
MARLTDDGVLLGAGGEPAARVVVATGPGQAAALLPGLEMPEYRTVTTCYHTAPRDGREAEVRGALAEAYGTGAWQPLTVRTVPDALPAVPPPQPLSRETATAEIGGSGPGSGRNDGVRRVLAGRHHREM